MAQLSRQLPYVVGLSAALILVVAACAAPGGGDQTPAGPAAMPTGVVSSTPLLPGPDGSSEPTPALVTPVSAEDAHPQRWVRAESVPGTQPVAVHAVLTGGPPCAVVARVDVAETDALVTITLWVGRQAGATCDGPQPQVALPVVTHVELEKPLGARPIRDGAQ
ncbi:MAG TPA: hypothetical protein VFP34_14650 [Microlunatus sp.]|nr:hypothetical protein [Microlunatus sp.]